MENKLEKRYGLFTAISMVVGIVIGSGVFFKAGKVLSNTNGNMGKCLITVGGVGLIMIICSYVFSLFAQKYEKVNGIVDYAEVALGPIYAYGVGWFMSVVYYPCLTSCLAWISAQYTCILFGWDVYPDLQIVLAAVYLICSYAINTLSPKLAGRLQVSATIIKLIPLILMAVVGTIVGLKNGMTIEAFQTHVPDSTGNGTILTAMTAFAFAYEGWIIATSINAELKNSKRNLPIALVLGSVIVIVVYMVYFVGLTGALSTSDMISSSNIPRDAFSALFTNDVFGTIAYVFVIISCLGTLNGLMLGCSRGMYSLASRNQGPGVNVFKQVDKVINIPTNSSIVCLVLCVIWLAQWEFGFIKKVLPDYLSWENDELPIIMVYACYIPIFLSLLKKGKGLNAFKRFIMPVLACGCCLFMIYAAIISYKIEALYYFIFFIIIMIIGFAFYRNKQGVPLYKRIFGLK